MKSYHKDSIDPANLRVNDRVEVCLCDTSATCVWSYVATVAVDEDGRLWLDSEQVNYRRIGLDSIDGCYAYLTKPFRA